MSVIYVTNTFSQVLYLATFLGFLINANNLCIDSFVVSVYSYVSCKWGQRCFLLSPFICLIFASLSRRCDNEHLCLVLLLEEQYFRCVTIKNHCYCGLFKNLPFNIRKFCYIPAFTMNRYRLLLNAFTTSTERIINSPLTH